MKINILLEIPFAGQFTEVPANFRHWITGGDAADLTIHWSLLGNDNRLTLQQKIKSSK